MPTSLERAEDLADEHLAHSDNDLQHGCEDVPTADDSRGTDVLKTNCPEEQVDVLEYRDDDGDLMCFRLENGSLFEFCNGRRVAGMGNRADASGVVSRLKWSSTEKEGWAGAIADQYDAGGLIPFEAAAKLRALADKAGVQHNIPDLTAGPPVNLSATAASEPERIISVCAPVGLLRSPRAGPTPLGASFHAQQGPLVTRSCPNPAVASVRAQRGRSSQATGATVVIPMRGAHPCYMQPRLAQSPVRVAPAPWLRPPQTVHLVRAT